MKRSILPVFIFSLLLCTFASCRKTDDVPLVHIALISPDENTLWRLPDTVSISFKITGDQAPDHVTVRIVNRNYIPLFGEKHIDAPEMGVELSETMVLHALHDTDEAPYYILISASVHEEYQNNYFPVKLTNKPLAYQGVYLFTKASVNQTALTFYKSGMEPVSFARVSGNFIASDISDYYQKLYLITDIPARLRAFSLTDQQQVWETEPLLPYPVYTDVKTDADRIYAGMGNGQITAYSGLTGQPKLVAERLTDSIPEKIAVLDEFVVGYYRSRINGYRSLVSFYKVSGVKKHRYPIDFELVTFLAHEDPANVVVVGNRDNEGLFTVFDPYKNSFEETVQPGVGSIETACAAWEGAYLFATADKLYMYQYDEHQEKLLKELNDIPIAIMYEHVSGTVFVAYSGALVLYEYPQMMEIARIEPENEIKGLALFYRYE